MQISEMIERLKDIQKRHGDLPVIMWSAGDVIRIQTGLDTVKGRHEVWLMEESVR